MREHICQIVSKEELAAYADGDLPPSETERIAAHIAVCSDCRVVAEAVERSLQVTQAVWQTAQAQWPKAHSFDRVVPKRQALRRLFAVAASVLFVLGAGAIWLVLSESSERTDLTSEEKKVAELRLKIADSSDAARLLAAAELLSKYPGAEGVANQRYRRIVDAYPETAAASQARLKLQ